MNRLNFNLKQLTLFLVAACGISSASAAITYSYTGNPFDTVLEEAALDGTYSSNNFVSISFTVPTLLQSWSITDGPIRPTSYILSDGRNTTTSESFLPGGHNFVRASFSVSTDAEGNIFDWNIFTPEFFNFEAISSNSSADRGTTRDCLVPAPFFGCPEIVEEYGEVLGAPGLWEITNGPSPVPLPAAVWLFGSALMGLLGTAKRQRKT